MVLVFMPEGPSIVILREEAAQFTGKKILRVSGNTRIGKERLQGQVITALHSWGKHFLICLPEFTLCVHFLLFGRYRINERKAGTPRLSLGFARGKELNLYACSLKVLEGDLDALYDWSADVMSPAWKPRRASARLKAKPAELAADVLLDQDVFAGVGNIIKNEVLFRIRVHPQSRIGKLPPRKRGQLVREAREYSFDFLEWKKAYVLRKHWQVHAKKYCPSCEGRLAFRQHLGLRRRRAFWCPRCQVLYK